MKDKRQRLATSGKQSLTPARWPGHRVLTRNRWREITRFKHLYYRPVDDRYVCVVVAGDDLENRFVVTAFPHRAHQERTRPVDKVRVYHDRAGNTLTVWFDDPTKEAVCEEIGDDVVLIKDRRGRVIGFERINYLSRKQQHQGMHVPVEVQVL